MYNDKECKIALFFNMKETRLEHMSLLFNSMNIDWPKECPGSLIHIL